MTTWRHFTPKGVRAWNVEALAKGTADATHPEQRESIGSLLGALEARGRVRAEWASRDASPGDFAMLDGRWHRIEAVAPGGRSRRPKFELQDVAYPDMPRHRVAWSDIERVARLTPDPSAKVK